MLRSFSEGSKVYNLINLFVLAFIALSLSSCQMSEKRLKKLKSATVIENPFEITNIESDASLTSNESIKDSEPTVVKPSEPVQPTEAPLVKTENTLPLKTKEDSPTKTKTVAPVKSVTLVPKKPTAAELKSAAMDQEIAELEKLYPFKAGERIEFTIRYGAFEAGHFTFEIKPTKQLEGRPVFHFYISARTSSLFAWIYTLKDFAESFWDMKLKRPYLMKIYGEESRYIREIQTTFDWKKKQARYQAKILEIGKGLDEEDKSWELTHLDAQDLVSSIYYLRTKDLIVGKSYDLRVAEKGKDILVRCKVVKEVELTTKLGKFMTYLVKPTFAVDGAWKQKGDMSLWLTKDKNKTPIQFEAKIKLGTIRGRLYSLTN